MPSIVHFIPKDRGHSRHLQHFYSERIQFYTRQNKNMLRTFWASKGLWIRALSLKSNLDVLIKKKYNQKLLLLYRLGLTNSQVMDCVKAGKTLPVPDKLIPKARALLQVRVIFRTLPINIFGYNLIIIMKKIVNRTDFFRLAAETKFSIFSLRKLRNVWQIWAGTIPNTKLIPSLLITLRHPLMPITKNRFGGYWVSK